MRASSAQILSAVRWVLHGVTLVGGVVLLLALPNLHAGTDLPGPNAFWDHGVLWIVSIYALMWLSEGWLRMRGRMPEPDAD